MRKIFFIVLASASLFACSNNNYTISGTVQDPSLEGKMVYISIIDNVTGDIINKDSVAITDGKYSFSGTTGAPNCCSVVARSENRSEWPPVYTTVVLEPGTISLVTNDKKNTVISGTPLNDEYQKYLSSLNEVSAPIAPIKEKLSKHRSGEKVLTDAQLKSLDSTLSAIFQKRSVFDYQNTKELINNPAICYTRLPVVAANNNSVEKLKELVAGANEYTKTLKNYRDVVTRIETLERTAVGAPFIDFKMSDPQGKEVSLSDYVGKGKYVFVDFWASWCGPCRAEMPNVVKAYKQFAGKDFEIVGVSLDSKKEAWLGAIDELGLKWPQMSDLKGWECIAVDLYAISGIPCTILFDRDGKILAHNLRGEDLCRQLGKLIKE
ncbi:MAG: AhpC/TSA family protein [Bacteroidales bacterium]|nr:AhpC/TSA family protein [Bacteroidales bacterium]